MSWWLPIVAFLAIAPFTPWLDLHISEFFYLQGLPETHFVSNDLTSFLFEYGTWPANITFAGALIVYLLSFPLQRWKRWRSSALLLVLTMILGAGVITNAILKDHWGRPRPKQVVQFGGKQEFRPFYSPNFFHQPEPSKSFSCGHCSTGFYFFALMLVGKRLGKRWLYWSGFVLAIGLGTALSLLRIFQGGHFLSDVLASALIMWLTALVCAWLVYSEKDTT